MRPTKTLLTGIVMAVGSVIVLLPPTENRAQEATAETSAAETAAEPVASDSRPAISAAERELFALNLYHEARSEGRDGMIAVGWVVFNRIDSDVFPDSITAVINEPTRRGCQWGWTCDGRSDTPTETDKWELAQEVADLLLSDARPADPTGGAVAFHETFRRTPGWLQRGATRTVTLQNHHFYRLN